jgi:hypothetical protein
MITIGNKHHDSRGVYVGRPTVLGNPYTLKMYTRPDAIARYRIWLRQQWPLQGEVHAALLQLARLYKAREQLTLVCWCAPQRCHAEVIREAVLGIVQHGLVERPPVHQVATTRPPCGRDLVYRLALHQPVLHHAEHGFADHLCVAALWCAPTRERELTPLLIPAGELQQRGVHLAMALPLLPQPDPIPRDGVGAVVDFQRVGIAEDGGSPHIDSAAALVLVDDGDHGMLLSCKPLGVAMGVASGVKKNRSSAKGFF